MSRARPPGHDVADQVQGAGLHLAFQQLGGQALARVDREVAVDQGAAQDRCGLDDPGETEELVLDRLQLGRGVVFVQRGGEAADPLT